jgi:hypothetical protein
MAVFDPLVFDSIVFDTGVVRTYGAFMLARGHANSPGWSENEHVPARPGAVPVDTNDNPVRQRGVTVCR